MNNKKKQKGKVTFTSIKIGSCARCFWTLGSRTTGTLTAGASRRSTAFTTGCGADVSTRVRAAGRLSDAPAVGCEIVWTGSDRLESFTVLGDSCESGRTTLCFSFNESCTVHSPTVGLGVTDFSNGTSVREYPSACFSTKALRRVCFRLCFWPRLLVECSNFI